MFKSKLLISVRTLSLLMMSCAFSPGFTYAATPLHANGSTHYRVTITNLTHGQHFGLPLVVAHAPSVSLFQVGAPASAELMALAEEGNSPLLAQALSKSHMAFAVATGSMPMLPGTSESFNLTVNSASNAELSVLGMLGTTNDTFGAVTHLKLPENGMLTAYGAAYDAGTERNSESCEFIPGPPCNHPGAHDPARAEGYVQLSSGIHGVGDLPPSMFDWRNPVIAVTVEKLD